MKEQARVKLLLGVSDPSSSMISSSRSVKVSALPTLRTQSEVIEAPQPDQEAYRAANPLMDARHPQPITYKETEK